MNATTASRSSDSPDTGDRRARTRYLALAGEGQKRILQSIAVTRAVQQWQHMAVHRRQRHRLVPDVEGGRVGVCARQLRHLPDRLVQPQRGGHRLHHHRIEAVPRLSAHDQEVQEVVDGPLHVGGVGTGGSKLRLHLVQQFLP